LYLKQITEQCIGKGAGNWEEESRGFVNNRKETECSDGERKRAGIKSSSRMEWLATSDSY